jgi:aldose 1-epimerase
VPGAVNIKSHPLRQDKKGGEREMKNAIAGVAVALALGCFMPAAAAQAQRGTFGTMPDGRVVGAVTLSNGHGITARIVAWGAMLQSLKIPGRDGKSADIVLAYPTMKGYLQDPQFFGAIVGRYANRIGGAGFTLDGKHYALDKNDGANSLHGGFHGFDKQLWTIDSLKSGPVASVTLSRVSPDGEDGYPGTLKVSITYALTDKGQLTLTYNAATDKPTIVNLTNHAIFNMAGAASGLPVDDQILTVAANGFTPVDAHLIPTGVIAPVAGTDFDFRKGHRIGDHLRDGANPQIVLGHGYDHNWVLTAGVTKTPHFAARLSDPVSGRTMEIWTTQPGLQVYTGNFLDGTVVGVDHEIYRQGDGIALETQHFPDSPHHPNFPSTRLNPGQVYHEISVYHFSVAGR